MGRMRERDPGARTVINLALMDLQQPPFEWIVLSVLARVRSER